MSDSDQIVLFTAFEPSGDALAAGMIRELLVQRPKLKVWAFGGPKMEAAGATIIEYTTEHAVMLMGAVSQAWVHYQRLGRLRRWLKGRDLLALVPVDSPAANWSICGLVRKHHPRTKIIHLPSPQVWAWASWRVKKLRRLTDKVLCILPFEPAWLADGVPATFVGHPMFLAYVKPKEGEQTGFIDDVIRIQQDPTYGSKEIPKLILLPGSRAGEWTKNWPMMLKIYMTLLRDMPTLEVRVVAVTDHAAKRLTHMAALAFAEEEIQWPRGFEIVTHHIASTMAWSDAVLAVSGTVTLEVAMYDRPMVVIYNINRLGWQLVGQWLVTTRTFALPNLISEYMGRGRAVKEFVPHFGDAKPVTDEIARLLRDSGLRRKQREALVGVCEPFEHKPFARLAVSEFLKVVEVEEAD